jgi:hypothetical protein
VIGIWPLTWIEPPLRLALRSVVTVLVVPRSVSWPVALALTAAPWARPA